MASARGGMGRALRTVMLTTDVLFTLYWALTALSALGAITIPGELLFADYHNPQTVAWNWSFFPLDLAFSLFGFAAVAADRRGDPGWRSLAIASLVLSSTAGGMAVAYWTLLGQFDPMWFVPNLVLFLWPIGFMPRLLCPATDGAA